MSALEVIADRLTKIDEEIDHVERCKTAVVEKFADVKRGIATFDELQEALGALDDAVGELVS